VPRCHCGLRGSLDDLLSHCADHWTDPDHGISLDPWQCGLCGGMFPPGIDPGVWETLLPDGRRTMAICVTCEQESES